MSDLGGALSQLGVTLNSASSIAGAASSFSGAIGEFNAQNLSPQSILNLATTGLGSAAVIQGALSGIPGVIQQGTQGSFESLKYADDLNAHHPKFKFLFKVGFYGFGASTFYYYVHRCDKPKVHLNHVDVNYYNFRTRVLTSVVFDPISFTFLDEIGNSTNNFFTGYLAQHSKTGNGRASTVGGGDYSSSIPYKNGSSTGQKIIIEQIFANGTQSNRFTLINPRIETFEFDQLNMEEHDGSMMTVSVSYDAITSETVQRKTLYSWGQTDLLKGGGTSGAENGGDLNPGGGSTPTSAFGGIGDTFSKGDQLVPLTIGQDQNTVNITNSVPGALADLVNPIRQGIGNTFNQLTSVSSIPSTISRDIQSTLSAVQSGVNLVFNGRPGPTTLVDASRITAGASQILNRVTGSSP